MTQAKTRPRGGQAPPPVRGTLDRRRRLSSTEKKSAARIAGPRRAFVGRTHALSANENPASIANLFDDFIGQSIAAMLHVSARTWLSCCTASKTALRAVPSAA